MLSSALPPWIDLTRPQRGPVRIMVPAIASVRPRRRTDGHGEAATVTLLVGAEIRVSESYDFVCRLLEGQDPNEPAPVDR